MGKAQVSIVTYSDYPTLFGQIGVFCAKHAANDLITPLVTVTSRATLFVISNSLKTLSHHITKLIMPSRERPAMTSTE